MVANAWLLPIQERIRFLQREGRQFALLGTYENLFAAVVKVGPEETGRKVENYDEEMTDEMATRVTLHLTMQRT